MTEKKIKKPSAKKLAALCCEVLDDGKADNIVQLEMTEVSVLADYFILCTANSAPHLKALSERLKRDISRKFGCKPKIDGVSASQWMVIDYGYLVVHILTEEMREHYQLEELWSDSASTDIHEKFANIAYHENRKK